MRPRFATVVLDVDSTLTGIEGIDWLAALREPSIAARIARLTSEAMAGERSLDEVYAARLDAVQPTRAEVAALAQAYRASIAPGAVEAVQQITAAGARIVLLTGGLLDAVLPLAAVLGVDPVDVHAVPIEFDPAGGYLRFDETALTTAVLGKRLMVEKLQLPRPVLAVGDGITDAEIGPAADAFAAYVGYVRREAVVERADFVLESFADLERLVLDPEKAE